jgi:hypothetical protein
MKDHGAMEEVKATTDFTDDTDEEFVDQSSAPQLREIGGADSWSLP